MSFYVSPADYIIKTFYDKSQQKHRTQLVIEGQSLYELIKGIPIKFFDPKYQQRIILFLERMEHRQSLNK